jgi:hypothetical protein
MLDVPYLWIKLVNEEYAKFRVIVPARILEECFKNKPRLTSEH